MFQVLTIAWRSIWRSRRRTLINMSAVAFGLAFLLLGIGIMESFMNEAQNDLGNTGMGHVEIYAGDYRLRRDVREVIADPDAMVARLEAEAPEGSRCGWRVVVQGLASSAWGSRAVRVHGVDPAVEARLSRFMTSITDGEPLRAGDARGIVIGDGLAEKLRLEAGKKMLVMAQRVDGEVGAELFRVRGIFHSISPAVNDMQAFVVAGAARELLGIGEAAHQVIAQLPQAAASGPVAAAMQTGLGDGYEVLSFSELFPTLEVLQMYMDRIMLIVIFGIYLLVGLGVLNTMLMSVMERTREFGVMMAVGTRRGRLMALVLAEAFWTATIAVVVGLAVGVAASWAIGEYGLLDWRDQIGDGMDFAGSTISSVMRPELTVVKAIQASIIVWVLTLLVGLYPAWRVSRLLPADALRAH